MLCYGTFGFGYIVPATFLPAMAQQLVRDPLVFGLTWPLFGLARRLVRGGCGTLAAGMAAPAGVGTGSWGDGTRHGSAPCFVDALGIGRFGGARRRDVHGGVGTVAGLQLAREQVPANPTPLLARMTAAFAAGQIAGLPGSCTRPRSWAGLDAPGLGQCSGQCC